MFNPLLFIKQLSKIIVIVFVFAPEKVILFVFELFISKVVVGKDDPNFISIVFV